MNNNTPIEQTKETPQATGGIGLKAVVRFIVFMAIAPAVLFVAAGHLDWVMGWIYVGMTIVLTVASRAVVLWTNPNLIVERAHYPEAENVKGWDRVIGPLVALYGPVIMWIVAGLDERFGWLPEVSPGLQLVALLVVALAYIFSTWAMAANRFFSANVRIQDDRAHAVATGGPYRLVRHPGYLAGVIGDLAIPLALGSLWALIPGALSAALIVVRTALEDGMLIEELPGYEEYTQQTRYRLLPGVW
jgi:protein-S-isoprenylcysteine O-methyltransferase Ste14